MTKINKRSNKVSGGVTAAWEHKKNPRKSKASSFRDWLVKLYAFLEVVLEKTKERSRDYCQNSAVGCLAYLVDSTLHSWETWLWGAVHVLALSMGAMVVWMAAASSAESPAATSRLPAGSPITDVPHPAVALCSLNLISRKRVYKFAESMPKNISEKIKNDDDIANILAYAGMAYDFKESYSDQLEELHRMIFPYKIDGLMRKFAISCEEMLLKCQWRGSIVECSKLFTFRKTSEGFCCVFNYLRISENFIRNDSVSEYAKTEPITALAGQDRGLSVLMAHKLEDYFFTKYPDVGIKVLIFNPTDYPDVESGSCYQQVLNPKTELYVALDAVLLSASKSVEDMDPSKRSCMIKADKASATEFQYDSYSDCMVSCRVKSIRASCGCVPFFLPTQWEVGDSCDFLDNQCLSNWKKHWDDAWYSAESGESGIGSSKPPCWACEPACSGVTYRTQQSALVLQPDNINAVPDTEKLHLKRNVVFVNHSVLHVFFSRDVVVQLKHDILYMWYDWLSNMGGLYGLVIGCSMLSVMELLYFIFGGPPRPRDPARHSMRELYWRELRTH